MKKKLFIALGTICWLAFVAAVAVVIYFWPLVKSALPMVTVSNVKVLYNALTTDQETSDLKIKENDQKFSEGIKDYIEMDIRDFTEDELKRIESGEVTQTQLLAQIIAESVNDEKPTEEVGEIIDNLEANEEVNDEQQDVARPQDDEEAPDLNDTPEKEPDETRKEPEIKKETADQIVARHVAALYELHSEFESRVGALATNAQHWMWAYKKTNPGITWKDAKVATMQHYIDTANAIESECYAKVDAQIEALRQDLKAIGADLSIVKTVADSAYNEMDIRKAKIVQEGTAKMNKDD